jgi:DNA-binding PadR family transcriptional regulator
MPRSSDAITTMPWDPTLAELLVLGAILDDQVPMTIQDIEAVLIRDNLSVSVSSIAGCTQRLLVQGLALTVEVERRRRRGKAPKGYIATERGRDAYMCHMRPLQKFLRRVLPEEG